LENGIIAEKGSVREVFANPKSDTAKVFIKINANLSANSWDSGGGI
jgi:D-methionine transport system ATP-binding protein